jgi:sugar lactone lactonase YvrE
MRLCFPLRSSLILTTCGFLSACGGGSSRTPPDHPMEDMASSRDMAPGADQGLSNDMAPAGDIGCDEVDSGSPYVLSFVAGGLGGRGNVDGTGTGARFDGLSEVVFDGVDRLYVSDSFNNTVRQVLLSTGEVTTLAGNPSVTLNGDDGTGADAHFFGPQGLALDGAGFLYVADSDNHTIRKIELATQAVTTLAGAAGQQGSADGTGHAARFVKPYGLLADGLGNLFISDSLGLKIRRVDLQTGVVATLAGSGQYGLVDNTGSAAGFVSPTAMAAHMDGEGGGLLYVIDGGYIRQVDTETGSVTTLTDGRGQLLFQLIATSGLAFDGQNLYYSANAVLTALDLTSRAITQVPSAFLGTPQGMTLDGNGNLFVTFPLANVLQKVVIMPGADRGTTTTIAGATEQLATSDGTGSAARFLAPIGTVSDGKGNMYVADQSTVRKVELATGAVTFLGAFTFPAAVSYSEDQSGNGTLFVADLSVIRQVDLTTGDVTTLAGSETEAVSQDGTGTGARFSSPLGLVSDGQGNLYVADAPSRIRKVEIATKVVTTVVDADAGLFLPWGVALDGAGNLYVADHGNNAIWKVDLTTKAVTILAGSPDGRPGYVDGVGVAARFSLPYGMASDGVGNLYVAESVNHAIRKIALATGKVTTFVGSPGRVGVLPGPLPAALNQPIGVAAISSVELAILDENSLLLVHPPGEEVEPNGDMGLPPDMGNEDLAVLK